jgi:imidazolonepropionase-like amidohydrolase
MSGEWNLPRTDLIAVHSVQFVNVRVFDGSGADAFDGEVRVEGDRIVAVAPVDRPLPHRFEQNGVVQTGVEQTRVVQTGEVQIVDGGGATLLPGLIESHAHLSFTDCARSVELGFIPPEEHVLATAANARKLLESGFTSCFSAASAKPRLDIVVRDAIERGDLPGPRLRAASPEMTVTAGLGDVRLPHVYRENFAKVCDGADEFRRYAREMVREGADVLKINVSGDAGTPASPADTTVMTDAEVAAVCDVAIAHDKRMAAHARSAESVKMALRHGVEVIYHATLVDEEAKDLLEAEKERVFVAPVLGNLYTSLYEAAPWGLSLESGRARGLEHELEAGIENMVDLKKRGVRILPGGDYGFAWNPNGTDARDIEHFVKLLGFSPNEALIAATRLGGEIMGLGDCLGQIRPGFFADLLLVDGDPLTDPSVLQDRNRFRAIMKGGRFHMRRD